MPLDPLLPAISNTPVCADQDRAKVVIGELQDVLRRHGCVLTVDQKQIVLPGRPLEFTLAWVTHPAMNTARRIAGIEYITPFGEKWRRIEDRPERKRT